MSHPCLSCGACCAHYRVGFHWSEAAPELGGHVPAELAEVLDGHRLAMRGTWAERPRCIALDAEIGVRACCTIHPRRPSVCREVWPSWEDGRGASPQCDRARLAHGLPALAPSDWAADRRIAIEVTVLPAGADGAPATGATVAALPLGG